MTQGIDSGLVYREVAAQIIRQLLLMHAGKVA